VGQRGCGGDGKVKIDGKEIRAPPTQGSQTVTHWAVRDSLRPWAQGIELIRGEDGGCGKWGRIDARLGEGSALHPALTGRDSVRCGRSWTAGSHHDSVVPVSHVGTGRFTAVIMSWGESGCPSFRPDHEP
jgi:hypothetical protein